MFTFIVTHALKNRVLVLVAAGVLVVFGVLTASRLPVDVFPDLNRPTVTIMTEAEGLAPQEVEQLVTYPDRDADERAARRQPRALGFGRRSLDRLCRVRLGHGDLPQPPAGRRAAHARAKPAPRQHGPADGSHQFHHGADPARRA